MPLMFSIIICMQVYIIHMYMKQIVKKKVGAGPQNECIYVTIFINTRTVPIFSET